MVEVCDCIPCRTGHKPWIVRECYCRPCLLYTDDLGRLWWWTSEPYIAGVHIWDRRN